jgi:hypothetical protein
MSAMENATDFTVTIAEKSGAGSRTAEAGSRIELGSSATSLTLGHELGHAWSHHSNDLWEANNSGQVATNWENAMRIGYGGVNRGVCVGTEGPDHPRGRCGNSEFAQWEAWHDAGVFVLVAARPHYAQIWTAETLDAPGCPAGE